MIELIQTPQIKPFFSHNNKLGLPLKMPGTKFPTTQDAQDGKKKPWSTSLGTYTDDQV